MQAKPRIELMSVGFPFSCDPFQYTLFKAVWLTVANGFDISESLIFFLSKILGKMACFRVRDISANSVFVLILNQKTNKQKTIYPKGLNDF